MSERRKVRWLIAHYPAYLFVRTAEVFRTELEKLCPGQFDLEIHTFDTYVNQYKKLDVMTQFPPEIPGLEEPSLLRPEFKGRDVDDFKKVQLRTAKILEAERVPKSQKLIRLIVDTGSDQRQILAGIGAYYEPEQLIGLTIVVVVNLKPAKLMGLESQGMLLAANSDAGLALVSPMSFAPVGAEVR